MSLRYHFNVPPLCENKTLETSEKVFHCFQNILYKLMQTTGIWAIPAETAGNGKDNV